MQTERKRAGDASVATTTPKAPAVSSAPTPSADSPSTAEGGSPFRGFLSVLVTPKITFSLPRRPQWETPADIAQDDLREAFLSRFPVRFEPSKLTFRCATPSLELNGRADQRLVYRIGAEDGDEERVLLGILRELDKAYSAKYEAMLEEARADLLSSSMSFQVVADEIREGQQAADKKWGAEVRQLKEQMSTNQKRLFLLEQENSSLLKTASSAEFETTQLRRSVASLGSENAALREQQSALEAQVAALREVVAAHLSGGGGGDGSGGDAGAAASSKEAVRMVSTLTQTQHESDEQARAEMAKWQLQLSRMSEWLRTGAQLLESPAGAAALGGGPAAGGGMPPPDSAMGRCSDS